jgi:hypothetical protein
MTTETPKRRLLPEWARDMIAVCGDDLMKAIVEDQRRGVSPPSGLTPQAPGGDKVVPVDTENRSGWRQSPPLAQPPGIDHVDRLCQQADLADRIEWIRKRGGGPV